MYKHRYLLGEIYKLTSKFNCKIFYLIFVQLFLFSIITIGQSELDKNVIQDTVQLKVAIDSFYSDFKANKDISEDRVRDILQASLALKDTASFFRVGNNFIFKYVNDQKFEEGIIIAKKIQNIIGSEKSPFGEFDNALGNLYLGLKRYAEALNYYFKSAEWYREYKENYTGMPLGNISLVYYTNENFDKALEYAEKALNYSLKLTNKTDRLNNLIYDYFNIANSNNELGNNEQAEIYFEKSLSAARELNIKFMILNAIGEALNFYSQIDADEKCIELINEADKICDESNVCQSFWGTFYLIRKNLHYLKIGLIDKAILPDDLIAVKGSFTKEAFEYSARYYTRQNDIDNTVKYYEKLIMENKRIERKNIATVYSDIEEKHLNKMLVQENFELIGDIEKRKKNTFFMLTALAFIFCFLILQLFNNLRYKKINSLLEENKIDLEFTNKELEQSNEELERFIFIASHDLKTPLLNILNFTNLLERELTHQEKNKSHQYLSFIKQGGLRLHNLITDTLEYSQLANQEIKLVEIDLNKLFEEIEHSISSYILEKRAKIIKKGPFPTIVAHHSSLVALFQNLFENGIKYNKSDKPVIKISSSQEGAYYSIFIEDNGIGIKQDHKDKIFTMYARLHNHSEYEGTGLGLAISKKIMKKMNGDILLRTKKGEGSLFELKFPINLIKTSTDL